MLYGMVGVFAFSSSNATCFLELFSSLSLLLVVALCFSPFFFLFLHFFPFSNPLFGKRGNGSWSFLGGSLCVYHS